jgi:hypothetical protein
MSRPRRVPVASLVLDWSLYPRQSIDTANVRRIADSVTAGETIPPVRVCRETRKVIDGFHRITERQRNGGDNPDILVEEFDYEDDQARFLDAVRLNARHGITLTPFDRARCTLLAETMGVTQDDLAAALAVDPSRLGRIRDTKIAYTHTGKPTPIRATLRHLAGTHLSEKQEAANDRASGMTVRFYVDQVVNAIEGDLVNWEDEGTVEALRRLVGALATCPLQAETVA